MSFVALHESDEDAEPMRLREAVREDRKQGLVTSRELSKVLRELGGDRDGPQATLQTMSAEAHRGFVEGSTRASFRLEGRVVPDDYLPSEKVGEFLAALRMRDQTADVD